MTQFRACARTPHTPLREYPKVFLRVGAVCALTHGVITRREAARIIRPCVVKGIIHLIDQNDELERAFDEAVPFPLGCDRGGGMVIMSVSQIIERVRHPEYLPVQQAEEAAVEGIARLPLGHARQLLMVLYIGRGDYSPRTILASNRVLCGEKDTRIIGEMIVGKRPASKYLRDGLRLVWGDEGGGT